jgi:hypothetical protein
MINRKEITPRIASRIILGALLALALFITGCIASVNQGKPTETTNFPLSGSEATIRTKTPDAQPQSQRLRITNQSAVPLHNLVVIFPDERIEFGDVPAGATTEYQAFSHGIYRYAAYNAEVDGQKYEQPVIDWVGEAPMQGNAFTYILAADPSRWKTEGQVIRLVKVTEDQSAILTVTPTRKVSSTDGFLLLGQLYDPARIADVHWTMYTGQLQGDVKGALRTFTLSYPAEWVVTANPTPAHFSVQNVPETVGGGPVAGDFVKLEVLPLKGPLPGESEGEKRLVRISGETGTLRVNATIPGQSLLVQVTLEKDGVEYVLAGYVNLVKEDQAALDRYQAMLLSMLASFQMD